MLTVIEDAHATRHDWAGLGLSVAARWDSLPDRAQARSVLREIGDEGVLISGSAATLSVVVEGLRRIGSITDVPIAFIAGDPPRSRRDPELLQSATLDLVETLALPRTAPEALRAPIAELPLVRNDIGGVMLVEAVMRRERAGLRRPGFGAQAYHDDQLIADGSVGAISVRPDYSPGGELIATVTPTSGRRRTSTTLGRAVQISCDSVPMCIDGRPPQEVDGRTWYVDDREHWLLRGATRRP